MWLPQQHGPLQPGCTREHRGKSSSGNEDKATAASLLSSLGRGMDECDRNTEMGANMPVQEPKRGSPVRWVAASIQPLRGLVCGLLLLGALGSQLLQNFLGYFRWRDCH